MPRYLIATLTTFTSMIGWAANFVLNSVFLNAIDDENGRWIIFIVLACLSFLAYLFVMTCVPDTSGKDVREMLRIILGQEKYDQMERDLHKEHDILYSDIVNKDVRKEVEEK